MIRLLCCSLVCMAPEKPLGFAISLEIEFIAAGTDMHGKFYVHPLRRPTASSDVLLFDDFAGGRIELAAICGVGLSWHSATLRYSSLHWVLSKGSMHKHEELPGTIVITSNQDIGIFDDLTRAIGSVKQIVHHPSSHRGFIIETFLTLSELLVRRLSMHRAYLQFRIATFNWNRGYSVLALALKNRRTSLCAIGLLPKEILLLIHSLVVRPKGLPFLSLLRYPELLEFRKNPEDVQLLRTIGLLLKRGPTEELYWCDAKIRRSHPLF